MLKVISRAVMKHPWRVLLLWLIGSAIVIGLAPKLGDYTTANQQSFLSKSYESIQAQDVINQKFPTQSGAAGSLVVNRSDGAVLSQDDQSKVGSLATSLQNDKIPAVVSAKVTANSLSKNGKVEIVQVQFAGQAGDEAVNNAVPIVRSDATKFLAGSGLNVGLTGSASTSVDTNAAYDHAEKANGTPTRRDWPMFYARAMAKEKLKKLDESEADIQMALKLSPEQPELLNYLGYSWVDRNRNIPEALTMLEKARTLRPYDGYIVDSVGWAYYQLGRYDEAAKTLEAAVLLVPGDPTINDHLGDALWRSGRRIDARFQWNHAITFSDNDSDKAAIEQKLKTGLSEKPA